MPQAYLGYFLSSLSDQPFLQRDLKICNRKEKRIREGEKGCGSRFLTSALPHFNYSLASRGLFPFELKAGDLALFLFSSHKLGTLYSMQDVHAVWDILTSIHHL